jgi:hypothetical protein
VTAQDHPAAAWEQVYLPPGAVIGPDQRVVDEATGEAYVGAPVQAGLLEVNRGTLSAWARQYDLDAPHPFPSWLPTSHARVGQATLIRPSVLLAWDDAVHPGERARRAAGEVSRRGGWPRGRARKVAP